MPDYKSMYFHYYGRTASAVDVLNAATKILDANTRSITEMFKMMKMVFESMEEIAESNQATAKALTELKETFEKVQQYTEEMFISDEDNNEMENE